MEQIYKWVDSAIIGGYSTSYQMMDENTSNALGIFLYQGIPDVDDMCGDIVYESINIHLQLNTEPGQDAIFSGLENVRNSVIALENSVGNDEITVVSCLHKGARSIVIGINEHNLPVIVANLELKYELT